VHLPPFERVPGNGFASVDAYLQFQRAAVGLARRAVEAEADAAWQALGASSRERFRVGSGDPGDLAAAWRRAWWIWAIGGRPRAPFEIGTSREHADGLIAALRPLAPPPELPAAVERWWRELTARARERIAGYVAARVAGSARRLAEDGVMDAAEAARLAAAVPEAPAPTEAAPDPAGAPSGRPSRRGISRAQARRVRAAEQQSVAIHRALDERFRGLGPVCGACTRETGGCCSLTVPLLWREADFRLMALGRTAVPAADGATPGACPFLSLEGCGLPSERRPHICRSFLCERAEAALGPALEPIRAEIGRLTAVRSQLG
jgi:hypothetical protein